LAVHWRWLLPMLVCAPTWAQASSDFPVEPGWTVLNAEALQALEGTHSSEDGRLSYRFDFRHKQVTLTSLQSGEVSRSGLTIHGNGVVQYGQGARSVVHARQVELRICATDRPLTCWPLRRSPPGQSDHALATDQALQDNAATALRTCGADQVKEVMARGFTYKP
jgi:hypothetical protein